MAAVMALISYIYIAHDMKYIPEPGTRKNNAAQIDYFPISVAPGVHITSKQHF